MGQSFTWTSPVADATWDKYRIKRAASEEGEYSVIATIDAKDSDGNWVVSYWDESGGTNHWYKVQAYNSDTSVEDSDSDPIGFTAIDVTYTTTTRVAALMQVTNFGGDTRPKVWEILEMIQRKEDEIDYLTGHAWRARYSGSTSGSDTSAPHYEYYSLAHHRKYTAGVPVYLNHRSVKDFSADAGDVLEVWDGSAYIDFLTAKTEGRANDWWLDNLNGVLYFNDFNFSHRQVSLRVKCRYGETNVPGDIQELCTLMVAYDLAMSSDRSYIIPEGGDTVKLDAKIRNWKTRIDELLMRRAEIRQTSM